MNETAAGVRDDQIIRKIRVRLVVPLLVLLFLSTIDRANVSFAALQMNEALGLTPETYGFGVSLFFVGYILIQLPSLWLLQRIGMRRWLFTISLVWGLAATAMAFVHSKEMFYALRVVLGIAEGGYAPGLMFYLASWIPKRYRAGAISNVMLAVPISVVVGGPLSGWLMSIDNPLDMAGWRWMFLIEGMPTVVLGIAVLWLFTDRPRDAQWLTADERNWIETEISKEQMPQQQQHACGWRLIGSGQLWAATACWFALMAGAQGLLYWLPQAIRHLSSGSSDLEVGVLSALPWVAIGAGMLVNAWHSDRKQERYLHVALAALASGVLLALTPLPDGVAALSLLILAGFFLGGAQSTFWTIPPTFLNPMTLAAGMGIINMCGNIAGLVVPVAVGWVRARTGSFDLPVYAIAAVLVLGACAVLLLRFRMAARSERSGGERGGLTPDAEAASR
ncbi:MFS family permease [Povalibacter uvarum]|uniref:MFS family permease n=1 Tax=Povalibacter uvarum TaxID=732238 RepID=A0A841HN86_9GAMM|nr:MFS transporter [Povalibacter uvarum]MBB6093809.1 MFS family permease [Povalibacter uvarum]